MRLQQTIAQISGKYALFEKEARAIAKQLTLADLLPYLHADHVNSKGIQEGELIPISIENGTYRIEVGRERIILYRGCSELTRFTGSKITSHYQRLSEEIKNRVRFPG